MIVNQTNEGQNEYPSIDPFKNSRRVLACFVAGLIISLVQYILVTTFFSPTRFWILDLILWILWILDAIAKIYLYTSEYIYWSIHQFYSIWAAILILQILEAGCYTYIIWISDDGSTHGTVTIVLSYVKFAIFVVTLIRFIFEYRKFQRINNTIRDSNFEPTIVATNVNDRGGQVAIVGRRPQNLAQLSVVSEMTNPSYDDLPPKYEDLDQPPTYEESIQLQQE
jgi:hypothetical protein